MHPSLRGTDTLTRGGAGRLDIRSLDLTVHELFTAGLAPATLKVYKTGTNRYNSFCVCYSVGQPFPVEEDMLMRFVAYLYKEGLKGGTIKSYLAGIRHAQIALGLGNPHIENMIRLEYVIRRVKRRISGPTRSRYPITLQLLAQMHHFWCVERSDSDSAMLWAAAAMCFFGFLRTGEVVAPPGASFDSSIHLSVEDVSGGPQCR